MSQNRKSTHKDFRPLPRGRHGLDISALKATRRARLLQAMMELVAQRGYAATTVPDVVAAARVSRNAFYEFFEDKEACFLALCDEQAADLRAVTMAYSRTTDWQKALRLGLRGYLRWWQQRPEFSRTYFVEMPTVGARASAQRKKAYEPFESVFRQIAAWVLRLNPQMKSLSKRMPRMLVVAVTEIVGEEVRDGRVHRLPDLEDDLMLLLVRMLGSPGEIAAASG